MNFIEFQLIVVSMETNSSLALCEDAFIGDFYQCAKFNACIKKCTVHLKFQAMPPDYLS